MSLLLGQRLLLPRGWRPLHERVAQVACSPARAVHAQRRHHRAQRSTAAAAAAASSAAPLSSATAYEAAEAAAEAPHVPVLLQEVLELLPPAPRLRVFVDGTLGAGGHSSAVLRAHPEMQALVGVDLDPQAHALAQPRLQAAAPPHTALHFVHANYSEAARHLRGLPAPSGMALPAGATLHGHVDAMLLDLGVSSMQLDTASRGFSFMRDGPLDMRMDPQALLSAEEVVNTWSEVELGRILRDYGEEKMWRQVARRIVVAREAETLATTQQLARAVGHTHLSPKGGGKRQQGTKAHIHPATRTFQALRIAVNDELGRLQAALPAAIGALGPGGRLAVISFHSLEDRAVKHALGAACGRPTPAEQHLTWGPDKFAFLDALEARAVARLVTRKPVAASEAECAANPRSRSAKLRVIERLPLQGRPPGAGR